MRRALGVALLLIGLAGCHAPPVLMPTPLLFHNADKAAFTHGHEPGFPNHYRIFVASDRLPRGGEDPTGYFGNQRGPALRLAVADVQLGRDSTTWTELVERSVAPRRRGQDPVEVEALVDLGLLDVTIPPEGFLIEEELVAEGEVTQDIGDAAFAEAINSQLRRTGGTDLYIFVHGFNTRFENNLAVGAGLYHYLGRQGAMLVYDWPSEAQLMDYTVDKANAAYTTRHFRQLLVWLSSATEARRIHILAHSAGNPIVVHALRDMRLRVIKADAHYYQERFRIGRVVLAAPDMDLWEFIHASLDRFQDVPEQVVVYMSARDRALSVSAWLFGEPRLGDAARLLNEAHQASLLQTGRIHAVDVSVAQNHYPTFLGHSYFWQNPWVSSDVLLYWSTGMGPAERGLEPSRNGVLWRFPRHYPKALQAAAPRFFDE